MTRFMMAGLLTVSCVLTTRAESAAPVSAPTYEAMAAARYIDLDFKGSRGQVQEYDGKLYRGAHGDVSVSNQGTRGLLDFSLKDIGSTEENGTLFLDHASGFKMSAKYETMHHRMNYIRVGEIHNASWLPKINITLRGVTENQELVMRRSETEVNFAFVSPENSARYVAAQYWSAEKSGVMSWSFTGSPNIQRTAVSVDNTKRDLTLGFGTNVWEAGALNLDLLRSEFEDSAPTLASIADGGTGSSNNGGVIKRQNGRQVMTGTEIKFRQDVNDKLSLTGAFTGRQRENLYTQYKFNAVVGALNAVYRASSKLSVLAKFYLRAYQIDENLGYVPTLNRAGAVADADTHQMDKTTVRGEIIANFRPIEKVHLKAAYKLEITDRRDAPTQVYSANRYYADGYFVGESWKNETTKNDTRHVFTLGAKAELPLGVEAQANYKKLQANRPAFVNLPNVQDDVNGTLSVPLPLQFDMTLEGGYLTERNTVTNYTHYRESRNTYRAGLDWSGGNRAFFGADISYEAIRFFNELYLGSGDATSTPTASTAYHASATNTQRNTVYGGHAKINLPKGFAVSGNGSYTRSTVSTPIRYAYATATVYDFTPGNVNIARGSVALEFTPGKFKNLTARASYAVSDWVDKYDELNSGRASVAQVGVAAKF